MTLEGSLNSTVFGFVPLHFPTAPCNALSLGPCHLLAFSLSTTVFVYDSVSYRRIRTLHQHKTTVTSLCWQGNDPVLFTGSLGEIWQTDLRSGQSSKLDVEISGLETLLWTMEVVVFTDTSGDVGCVMDGVVQIRIESQQRCDKSECNGAIEKEVLLLNREESFVRLLKLVSEALPQSHLLSLPIPKGHLIDAIWAPHSQSSLLLLYPWELHVFDTVSTRSDRVIPNPCASEFSALLYSPSERGDLLTMHADLTCSIWDNEDKFGFTYGKNSVILARTTNEIKLISAQIGGNEGKLSTIAVLTSDLRLHIFTFDSKQIRIKYLEKLAFDCPQSLLSTNYILTTSANMLYVTRLKTGCLTLELAFQGDIQALCCREEEAHLALSTPTGTIIEGCDVKSGRSLGTLLRFENGVKAMEYDPNGLILAVMESKIVHFYQRETIKQPFHKKTEAQELPSDCSKLVWTASFGLVLFGGPSTFIISQETHTIPLEVHSICQAASFLLLSSANRLIYVWDGREANATQYKGDIISANEWEVLLYWEGRETKVSLEDMRATEVGNIELLRVGRGIGWTATGLVVFQPRDTVNFIEDSPVFAQSTGQIKPPASPSATITPHFNPLTFEFDHSKGPIPSKPHASPKPQSIPEIEESQVLADHDELRFWTIVKSFDAILRPNRGHHSHNLSAISAVSLENMRKSDKKNAPKTTSRAVIPVKSRTPTKKPQRTAQSKSKGGFSTPVKDTVTKRPTKTASQRPAGTSQSSFLSEKKHRPESDVFKLALNTSALLKTCFDSNRKRQVLASDGESQVTDTGLDFSDIEGSCKSESPSPGLHRRSNSTKLTEEVFTTTQAEQREMGFNATSIVCRELIATSQSSLDCRANILKACFFASTGSAAFQQTILCEAGHKLKELGYMQEAVEVLSLAGCTAEACSILQSAGRWGEAVLLARRLLGSRELKEVVRGWAMSLCDLGEYLEAVKVSLEQERADLVPEVLQRWGKTELSGAFLRYSQPANPSQTSFPV